MSTILTNKVTMILLRTDITLQRQTLVIERKLLISLILLHCACHRGFDQGGFTGAVFVGSHVAYLSRTSFNKTTLYICWFLHTTPVHAKCE